MAKKALATAVVVEETSVEKSACLPKVTFPVDDDCIRKITIKENGYELKIYHIYPRLSSWFGRQLSEEVNPRTHGAESIKSSVAKAIEETIRDNPEDFYLANRGSTILAEDLHYNKDKGTVDILINDPDLQGIADGATTDAVLAHVRKSLMTTMNEDDALNLLRRGRIHLEVIVGLRDKDRIDRMVLGRNTSRQVKAWSMSDFRGDFDWIQKILDKEFPNKIGYEENAGKAVTVLDVLSLLTLFHPEYDNTKGGRKAPTVAYSGKGRMDSRLNDKALLVGYKSLASILPDILKLHDYVYSQFHEAYKKAKDGRANFGRRQGVEPKKHNLHFTGDAAEYVIPSGLLFPLLASMRALITYSKDSDDADVAEWRMAPNVFFDESGADLVETLIEQVESFGGNPQTAGKKKSVYLALHDRATNLVREKQSKF